MKKNYWRNGLCSIMFIGLLCGFFLRSVHGSAQYWENTYGGFGSDRAETIASIDDGFFVAGSTGSFGLGSSDIYLLRLDLAGQIVWSNYYGGQGVDQCSAILVDDEGVLMVGYTNSSGDGGYNGYVVRLDLDGTVQWEREMGSPDWDFIESAVAIEDGWILTGTTFDQEVSATSSGWIVRIDHEGEIIFDEFISGQSMNAAYDIVSVGGYAYVGGSATLNDISIATVWKFTLEGEQVDVIEIPVEGNAEILGMSTHLEGFAITGYIDQLQENRMMLLGYHSENGELMWYRTHGTVDQHGNDIITSHDNGFAMVGYTEGFGAGGKDLYVMLTDENGYFQAGYTFGLEEDDIGNSIIRTQDGYAFAGSTASYGPGVRAMHVIRTNASVSTQGAPVVEIFDPVSIPSHSHTTFSIHPNPVSPGNFLNIKAGDSAILHSITLTDLSGRVVAQDRCTGCNTYPVPQLAKGMYHITLEFSDGARSGQTLVVD